ncbi:DUF1186 domain-containing protein [Roseibium sp.]|uniref:DUF1186 domain-containing protein n=1 Tax=Roseibium sp. TaxID=1936156 RepID=UPI003B5191EA
MDRRNILEDLASRNAFPVETIPYCLDNPQRSAAIFLPLLGKAASGSTLEPTEEKSLYLGIHILAALRISAALSPLLDLATKQPQLLFQILGEVGIATTLPRILMCLADGRGDALWQVVKRHELDFLIRDACLRAWTYEALNDRMSAVAVTQALRAYLDEDDAPEPDDPIWSGWLIAIADLGHSELEPIAVRAIETGRILAEDGGRAENDVAGFKTALQETISATDLSAWLEKRGYVPFGKGERDWGDCFLNAPQPPHLL